MAKNKNNVYRKGTKVRVKNSSLQSFGMVGIIESFCQNDTVKVRFDSFPWSSQINPVLTIKKSNLTIISQPEQQIKEVKETQKMSTIRKDEKFQVVKIKFIEGFNLNKQYLYAAFERVEVGDMVVVKSAHHGFNIAKVTAIIENPSESDVNIVCEGREIVDKFTMEYYDKRIADREQHMKDENRKAELKIQMRTLAMKDKELTMFTKIAEFNSDMKNLLDEYTAICKKNEGQE